MDVGSLLLLLALAALCGAVGYLSRGGVARAAEERARRIADLEARIDATHVTLSKLGERLGRPQQTPSVPSAASTSPGYQIAIRLAKSGAAREELVSKCGLSTHEAELVHRLYAPKQSTRQAAPNRSHAA